MVTNPDTLSAGTIEASDSAAVLASHKLCDELPLLAIGSFDTRVTVLSQQTRALNLAWALIETDTIPIQGDRRIRIAVVGTGFAGLTLTAGLLRKGKACDIVLFEQRDSLLPLQQGSDTRWLHPHIYDWPADGSEASAAMLPVLNWTAARSSDVVVQVLSEWRQVVEDKEVVADKNSVRLFCNTRHLQIAPCRDNNGKARLEWVGEERNPLDGTTRDVDGLAGGSSETFDLVILAVGFGLEAGAASYWRNETLGQPILNEPRRTYLLSGQGDGAMIDLLRIRVSQFRQDRILEELFGDKPDLVLKLRTLRQSYINDGTGLFELLEQLTETESPFHGHMADVLDRLRRRLRRDTDVVLRLLVRNISELLEPSTSRISFQNALLVFLLYRCGGFAPTTENETTLRQRFSITKDLVIQRHGVRPLEQIRRMIPPEIFDYIAMCRTASPNDYAVQLAVSRWPGGYFGYKGRAADIGNVSDEERREWRKEYLPGPTALVATTLCGAVVAAIERLRPDVKQFRVTLHRTLSIHKEHLLQQACDYQGRNLVKVSGTAGRTFPVRTATIGAAYRCRRVIRTIKDVDEGALQEAMNSLKLLDAARKMESAVNFVLAIPLLQPDNDHYAPSPVTAVLYVDSQDDKFWLSDQEVDELCRIVEVTAQSMSGPNGARFGRIRNIPLEPVLDAPHESPENSTGRPELEIVDAIDPPSTTAPFVLNFDHTDLAPATTEATTPASKTTRERNA